MKIFSVILSFCLILVMSSCSSVMVNTDIHNPKDFEKYTTYNWVEVEGNTANLQMDQQTKKAIENVMATKGFSNADQNEPDLLIDFDYDTRFKIDVIPYYHDYEPFTFYLQGNSELKC